MTLPSLSTHSGGHVAESGYAAFLLVGDLGTKDRCGSLFRALHSDPLLSFEKSWENVCFELLRLRLLALAMCPLSALQYSSHSAPGIRRTYHYVKWRLILVAMPHSLRIIL